MERVYPTRAETWELVHGILEAIDEIDSSATARDTLAGELELSVQLLLERYFRTDE